ncbi:hypothetical protein DENIS_4349 [Desulfonema ishimotonii]|uniref:TRAP transporter TatT component family protein n=1 Tax=Desulfonema ishimotonii TaxID=45657 RepID=A0A401G2K7_9BACT|nr:TRAP transporter TatT component family protein [Desulfonema ishimotonii]GBC63355.1 hypothetical protein DENIS_4349 [Desulfonema ishimotonii]
MIFCQGSIRTGRRRQYFRALLPVLSVLFTLSGCISSFSGRFADNLSYVILNNNDLETVKTGGPAYLLMTDSLLRDDPDNDALLRAAASLYTAYTDVYVEDPDRARKLTDKGLNYAFRAVCSRCSDACALRQDEFKQFEHQIREMDADDVPALYTLGTAWAGWIQAHREDWNAIAEIARVEVLMQQVIRLDETYRDGSAHLYLGILNTLLPPALGGKPEEGRQHFERVLTLSGGRNLMVKVTFARQYARLVFDRALHDRLLQEVLAADPDVEGYALVNALARKQAKALLESADEYF